MLDTVPIYTKQCYLHKMFSTKVNTAVPGQAPAVISPSTSLLPANIHYLPHMTQSDIHLIRNSYCLPLRNSEAMSQHMNTLLFPCITACKWVKPIFWLGCDVCIFHGTGNSTQLCWHFGISGGFEPPTQYATARQVSISLPPFWLVCVPSHTVMTHLTLSFAPRI
jgi:hypothetical protein